MIFVEPAQGLVAQELVLVLAVGELDEDEHGACSPSHHVFADGLAVDLMIPAWQAHDLGHGVIAFS